MHFMLKCLMHLYNKYAGVTSLTITAVGSGSNTGPLSGGGG
jgi:hypothetical protein